MDTKQPQETNDERAQRIAADMLLITGPVLKISEFDKFSGIPAAQTIRNTKKDMPKDFFMKYGHNTLMDMRKYLPYWASKLAPA